MVSSGVGSIPGSTETVVATGSVKLRKGESLSEAVKRLREQITGLATEQAEIRDAGGPVEEIRAQAKRWVEMKARLGRPRLQASHTAFDVIFGDPSSWTNGFDPAALACWLDPDRVTELLYEEIDKL